MKTKRKVRFPLAAISVVFILLFTGTAIQANSIDIHQQYQKKKSLYLELNQYVTDIENNRYKTVKIGTQTWMAENLKTTKYRDGTSIELVTNGEKWKSQTIGAYCYINNTRKALRLQGLLYNGAAIKNPAGICPEGWRVPTSSDLMELQSQLGGQAVAGGKMKSTGSHLWQSPNTGATNESGFAAAGNGYRLPNGNYSSYKQSFRFWTSSEYGLNNLIGGELGYGNSQFGISALYTGHGHCVRCIKN